uniref:Uncharacterized protein n=1 Tax=Rhipicephalus microplus TaxID=6941 RepID=A0A6G5AFK5_RHIMP
MFNLPLLFYLQKWEALKKLTISCYSGVLQSFMCAPSLLTKQMRMGTLLLLCIRPVIFAVVYSSVLWGIFNALFKFEHYAGGTEVITFLYIRFCANDIAMN